MRRRVWDLEFGARVSKHRGSSFFILFIYLFVFFLGGGFSIEGFGGYMSVSANGGKIPIEGPKAVYSPTLNPTPYTLNPKPQTLHPKP